MNARLAKIDSDGLRELARSRPAYHESCNRYMGMTVEEFWAVDHTGIAFHAPAGLETPEGLAYLDASSDWERTCNPEQDDEEDE